MKTHILTLGKTPKLSLWEISNLLGDQVLGKARVINQYQLELVLPQSPATLMARAGGVVKIGEASNMIDFSSVASTIVDQLQVTSKRQKLALSTIGNHQINLNRLGKEIKTFAKERQLSISFRLLQNIFESSGLDKDYQEFQIIEDGNRFIVSKTVAVQNIEKFTIKDYGRPKFDTVSGMLPPKIARMMINIATRSDPHPDTYVYDPMCGSGTILIEALDLGFSVLGSDLSQRATEDAQLNCQQIGKKLDFSGEVEIWQEDATQLNIDSKRFNSLEAIVFEGYLGPQQIEAQKIHNMTRGLVKMYTGIIKRLAKIQPIGSSMVCALPEFNSQPSVKMIDELIDSCEKYGYTQVNQPVTYGREGARVKRRIYKLTKS
jgi:tRNA G10  N-methylase Trm11